MPQIQFLYPLRRQESTASGSCRAAGADIMDSSDCYVTLFNIRNVKSALSKEYYEIPTN